MYVLVTQEGSLKGQVTYFISIQTSSTMAPLWPFLILCFLPRFPLVVPEMALSYSAGYGPEQDSTPSHMPGRGPKK